MSELTPLERALILERSVWAAVSNRDRVALDELLADDYTEITLEGKRLGRDAIVAQSPEVDSVILAEMTAERVTVLSTECLMLSYHLSIEGTSAGRQIHPRERWATSVWVCRDGVWVCTLFQQSSFLSDQFD